MENNPAEPPLMVGNPESKFWLFDYEKGYDLTHPSSDEERTNMSKIHLHTTTAGVTIAPEKTALVVIDMQNYFLSDRLDNIRGLDHDVEDLLLKETFPVARKAGIQIIHITWGISEEELAVLPPVIFRAFSYDEKFNSWNGKYTIKDGAGREGPLKNKRIGDDLADADLRPNSSSTPVGRFLMRDQWNTALHERLQKELERSQSSALPDQHFYKAWLSGFWGVDTPVLRFLKEKNITTLLFAGRNKDQAVLASLHDASSLGLDTILLKDGCPLETRDKYDPVREMMEFHGRKSWGFVSSSKALREGIEPVCQGPSREEYLRLL